MVRILGPRRKRDQKTERYRSGLEPTWDKERHKNPSPLVSSLDRRPALGSLGTAVAE